MKHDKEPLTLEQLRQMDGQPAWGVRLTSGQPGEWFIVRVVEMSKVWFIASAGSRQAFGDKNTYGKDWLAYDCKPNAEPARVSEVMDIVKNIPADRLRELVEADKDGRLYKFRFGVGSTVYRVWVRPDGTHPFISEDKVECLRDMMRAELWAESYSTREEAEAALEKLRGANHG